MIPTRASLRENLFLFIDERVEFREEMEGENKLGKKIDCHLTQRIAEGQCHLSEMYVMKCKTCWQGNST